MKPEETAGSLRLELRRGRIVTATLIVGAVLVLFPGVFLGLPWCKFVVGGDRIARGELPYRDFWTMYAPGAFYAQATIGQLLGRELWIQGAVCIGLVALSAGLFLRLHIQRGTPLFWAAALAMVLVLASWRSAPELTSYPPALLLTLSGLFLVDRFLATRFSGTLFIAGLAFGGAAVFKHDVAAYAFLACTFGLLPLKRSWPRSFLILAAGSLAIVGPLVLWLATVAPGEAFEQLILFPATTFPAVFAEDFPPLVPRLSSMRAWLAEPANLTLGRDALNELSTWTLAWVPAFVLAASTLHAIRRWRLWSDVERAPVLIFLLWIPPFWLAAHVQQNTHFLSMALGASFLGASVLRELRRRPGAVNRVCAALFVICASLQVMGLMIPPALDAYRVLVATPHAETIEAPRARHLRLTADEAQVYGEVLEFLATNLRENEPFYAGLVRHDAVVIGNQRFYALAERPVPTRFNELHPGVVDHVLEQRELQAELERSEVRCIVLWDFGWAADVLDEIRAARVAIIPELGARELDAWIDANFNMVRRIRRYRILWRRGAAPP